MKRELKEEFLKEVYLKEIESIDRDETQLSYKILVGIGVVVLFAYGQELFHPKYFWYSFCITLIVIAYWLNANSQIFKYVSDCYSGLRLSIIKGDISNYKIPQMRFSEVWYYKRKFYN